MSGRHSARPHRRRPPRPRWIVAVAALLPVAVGGVLYSADAAFLGLGGCSEALHVSVAATEETVDVLEGAAASLEARGAEADGHCVKYHVTAAAPNEVARSLDARAAGTPDLWVPDSSAWLARIDGFAGDATVVARSLARSPVVVASRSIHRPHSWLDVLSRDDVEFVDPLRSSAPAAALLALRAELDSTRGPRADIDSVMVPLAQRLGDAKDSPRDLTDLVLNPGGAAILSEQQLLNRRAHGLGRDLAATVPETGTMVLNYPLVTLTEKPGAVEAAEELRDYLRSPEGADELEVAGFRHADLAPLPRDRGAGVVRVLPTPPSDAVATMLRRWSVLTVPSRILGVFDVSGSMDELASGRTRVTLASQASSQALGMFPDQSRIGMWAFSVGLGGPDVDHRELVGIRRLDAQVGGKSQRQLLGRALAELPRLTNGGTGLYDTTLSAVRALRSGYDQKAVNTLVLLTDGRNEDPSSISLPDLIRTLRQERDRARPVSVIAIGVGPDADDHSLRRIVAATGGRSYVARDPADIGQVFRQALLAR